MWKCPRVKTKERRNATLNVRPDHRMLIMITQYDSTMTKFLYIKSITPAPVQFSVWILGRLSVAQVILHCSLCAIRVLHFRSLSVAMVSLLVPVVWYGRTNNLAGYRLQDHPFNHKLDGFLLKMRTSWIFWLQSQCIRLVKSSTVMKRSGKFWLGHKKHREKNSE